MVIQVANGRWRLGGGHDFVSGYLLGFYKDFAMILVRMSVGFYYEFIKILLGFTGILLILQILPDIAATLNIVLTCRKRALALPLNCNYSCSVCQDPQFSPALILLIF